MRISLYLHTPTSIHSANISSMPLSRRMVIIVKMTSCMCVVAAAVYNCITVKYCSIYGGKLEGCNLRLHIIVVQSTVLNPIY